MAIVGRKEELLILGDLLRKKGSQFVVVYGRRRVGKTFLINEYFDNRFSFKVTAARDKKKVARLKQSQLKIFQRALNRYGDSSQDTPKDWFEAFDRLSSLLNDQNVYREPSSGKRIVFIDEIPWFDTPKSEFKAAFDLFWNEYGSTQPDLLLFVCGSAASWIIENILESRDGMHNRSTCRIHIRPMNLRDVESLLSYNDIRLPRKQIIEYYMVFGGIPYYLNLLSPRFSVSQNIDRLCFDEGGALHHELEELFASLFVHHENHLAVIKALSSRRMGLTRDEIIEKTDFTSGSKLTKILKELERCSFIRRYEVSGRETYQLVDLFTMFALNYLEGEEITSWVRFSATSTYQGWCGYAFEIVCLNNVPSLKAALGIQGVEAKIYPFYVKEPQGTQIDLVIDRDDGVANLCEMKYTVEPFVIDKNCHSSFLHKIEAFRAATKKDKALLMTLVSAEGLKKNAYSDVVAVTLTAEDLFLA